MDEHVCMPLFVATHRSQVCLRLKDITMSLNEPVRLKSQSKRKRSESERTAKNKRHKSKRAASPTSSYLSVRTDWSIDPPTNFKDGETSPLHSRIKRKRETSPVTSYISLKSDNPMNISKCNTFDLRERAASPTCISMKTDWSIDPPTNFKAAETFPLDPRLLTEQHLRCPVCKLMLKNPVSIPCGHNYCNGCINAFWDNCAGEYVCPHCGKASETRPVLSINAALAEVVKNMQQASFSPALPPQSYAGPEDVACDFCIERRLKSVKFCSNCDASICETHVRQHYTIPALQKHILSDVTGDIKTRPSQEGQNSNNSLNSTASGQQHHTDKTQDIMKEIAVATKLQTRLKRSAKTFRPKTKEKKDNVRSVELMCSTLQQEVSVLKEKLSKLETKNTKKEKSEDEDDYGEEYDKEEGSEEDDDVYGEEYDKEEDSEEDDDVYGEKYEEQVVEEDYGEEDEEEYEEDDYREEEEKYGEDYSEKDFDAESDEEDEGDEDSFDDEDRYKDDYDGLEDYWKETGDEEDYDDENNSEEDSDEDYYKDY